MEETPNSKYYGVFREAFRNNVHELLAWGYTAAKLRVSSNDEQETAITGHICSSIKDRLQSFNCPPWAIYYSIHDDPPVEYGDRSGRSRLRADIIIEGTAFPGRPEYLIEAKRLKRPQHPVKQYISENGMGCFIDGKYGSRYDEVMMIGYIQSDEPAHWNTTVQDAIRTHSSVLQFQGEITPWKAKNAFDHEWFTEHTRPHIGRVVRIYHILFDFRYD